MKEYLLESQNNGKLSSKETDLFYETLKSIANSNFPKHKLQILAIDDGSKDETWNWMKKAKQELGNQIVIFRQPDNKGK